MLLRVTRRRFLQTGAGIGGLALTERVSSAVQSTAGKTRPGGLVHPGDWWAGGGPRQAAHSSTIVQPDEPGERLVLSGTVYAADGRTPLPGVTVYVYQTDVHGLYNPEGKYGVPHRIRGWVNTDRDGFYEIHTIKPGLYPNRTTPAHIHMTVSRQDMPEWWLPEIRFEGEPLVTPAESQASATEGRFGNIRPVVARGGRLYCARDLRL
jgi:protocatechuate 3,4-dioxygenase beta subunit